MTDAGLYVHIPFCNSKCKYCSFASSVQTKTIQATYFEKLNEEILASKHCKNIKSIFFGGGTPTAVCPSLLCQTLENIKKHFCVLNNAEITLEANPNSVSPESLLQYKSAGFNRISFGVQSFENETLKLLGRTHTKFDAFNAVEMAKLAGFENISIDLIIGAQTLDEKVFADGILKMKKLGVTHISVYMLMLEDGTKLFEDAHNKTFSPESEEEVVKDYRFVQKTLESFGFLQYEISNFALNAKQCWHNENYWACGEYYGFGLSAHSYINDVRAENTADLSEYLSLPILNLAKHKETLTNKEKITEIIMLSLRTTKGLSIKGLKDIGHDILKEKKSVIENLIKNKMVEMQNGNLKILKPCFVVSNQIILKLI